MSLVVILINTQKTKTMVFQQEAIELGTHETITEFVYLGSLLTWDNDCNRDQEDRTSNWGDRWIQDSIEQ